MNKGKFITIEGVEGVGKSTNIEHLQSLFDERNIKYILTREPGGTLLGERIRELLLSISDETLDVTAELLLVFAARAQHVQKVIRPALEKGMWVLCDRFTDATFAYQGAGRGIDEAAISMLQTLVQHSLRPDLTIILDLDPVIGMQRAVQRGALDRFEQEKLDFFERVRAGYLAIAAAEPHRCAVVDASRSLPAVQSAITDIMLERVLLP